MADAIPLVPQESKPDDSIYDEASKKAKERQQQRVARSKKIAERFERLLKQRLTTFFRVEVSISVLSIVSLIIAAITYTFSPGSPFSPVPIAANALIIPVAVFGAALSFFPNSFDKTQQVLTGWLVVYILTFVFATIGEVMLVMQAITSYAACYTNPAGPSNVFCTTTSLVGLVSFNTAFFFAILAVRGITLIMGVQLYQLLTTTKNAVVRSQAKIDTRRSLSTRRKASFHSVDGSERIAEGVPRKPIPEFKPSLPATDSTTDLHAKPVLA